MIALLESGVLQSLADSFEGFEYLAPFTVLFLCGIGLPLPEEVSLIGSGLMVHDGRVEFLAISVTCGAAILLGDSVPYWLGRRYGMNILQVGWVRRILHPERFALLEKRFLNHGNWAIFTCRFLPGIRIPGYFSAGTLKMPFVRFIVLDTLGVLISVPLSIYLGKLFADQIDELESNIANFHQFLAFTLVTLALVMFFRARHRKRAKQAAETVVVGASAECSEKATDGGTDLELDRGPELETPKESSADAGDARAPLEDAPGEEDLTG